jgi:hypothetical protein
MNKERIPPGILPSFETMPELSDESIADVLTWLVAFVDAFEDYYAGPLSRWRQARYQELHQKDNEEQLRLPIGPRIDDPF